ncbi:22708_t:CDS:1, partial [Gigaspora margarita]
QKIADNSNLATNSNTEPNIAVPLIYTLPNSNTEPNIVAPSIVVSSNSNTELNIVVFSINASPNSNTEPDTIASSLSRISMACVYPCNSQNLDHYTLGRMDQKCCYCGALMWLDERVNKSKKLTIFSTCCAKGKITLPPLQNLPPSLNTLLTRTDPRARSF